MRRRTVREPSEHPIMGQDAKWNLLNDFIFPFFQAVVLLSTIIYLIVVSYEPPRLCTLPGGDDIRCPPLVEATPPCNVTGSKDCPVEGPLFCARFATEQECPPHENQCMKSLVRPSGGCFVEPVENNHPCENACYKNPIMHSCKGGECDPNGAECVGQCNAQTPCPEFAFNPAIATEAPYRLEYQNFLANAVQTNCTDNSFCAYYFPLRINNITGSGFALPTTYWLGGSEDAGIFPVLTHSVGYKAVCEAFIDPSWEYAKCIKVETFEPGFNTLRTGTNGQNKGGGFDYPRDWNLNFPAAFACHYHYSCMRDIPNLELQKSFNFLQRLDCLPDSKVVE